MNVDKPCFGASEFDTLVFAVASVMSRGLLKLMYCDMRDNAKGPCTRLFSARLPKTWMKRVVTTVCQTNIRYATVA